MAKYKNGLITSESIITTAKECFKQYGLKKTTISLICKSCDIKLGTFTYYYSKKDDLLSEIYSSYMQKCRDFINSQNLDLKECEKHIYVVALYYYNIYYYPEIFHFHKEVLSVTSMNNVFENPNEMIDDFASDGKIEKDSSLYDIYVKADNAIRREFNLMYFSSSHNNIDDIKKLLTDIYLSAATLFQVDMNTVLHAIESGYKFAKEKGNRDITLL